MCKEKIQVCSIWHSVIAKPNKCFNFFFISFFKSNLFFFAQYLYSDVHKLVFVKNTSMMNNYTNTDLCVIDRHGTGTGTKATSTTFFLRSWLFDKLHSV